MKTIRWGILGCGKTDDTAAIQRALTAGLANHRVVYLPDGVYLVSDRGRLTKRIIKHANLREHT